MTSPLPVGAGVASSPMGNQLGLTLEEMDEVRKESQFSEDDIQELLNKFQALDADNSGTLSFREFMAVPSLENNPLAKRVVEAFDQDRNGEVDFKEFLQSLSIFTKREKEEKYRFTFKVYDVDGDGFISNADLFHVLKAMVGSNLNDVQLQQLVDRTILKGDKDKDGKLNYEEFLTMVDGDLLENKMIIDFGSGEANSMEKAEAGSAIQQPLLEQKLP